MNCSQAACLLMPRTNSASTEITLILDSRTSFRSTTRIGAVDLASGKLLWQHHTVKELRGKEAEFGMACSPLVVGELVIGMLQAIGDIARLAGVNDLFEL